MNLIQKIAIIIWKVWFFFILIITTIFFSILALTFSFLLQKYAYPFMYFLCVKPWGYLVLFLSGIFWEIEKGSYPIKKIKEQVVFIANHTSIIDIFLLAAILHKPIMFVGKASLGKIPLFGNAYKKVNILVDRKSSSRRRGVLLQARHFMSKKKRSLVIFPEGGIPKYKTRLAPFKSGTFVLALEQQCPLVPISLDRPARFFSYKFIHGGPGKVKVRIHTPIYTSGKSLQDKNQIRDEAYQMIDRSLENFEKKRRKI